jgi:hypothetical protein
MSAVAGFLVGLLLDHLLMSRAWLIDPPNDILDYDYGR